MKRWRILTLALLLAALLCACGGGNADNVLLEPEASSLYTEEEIVDAMQEVCRFFEREFDGCTLTTLSYSEDLTLRDCAGGRKEAVTLLSEFETGPSGGDGSLNPNQTYTRYQWTLVRSAGGRWTLEDWGYG